jgi:hypothetical protein
MFAGSIAPHEAYDAGAEKAGAGSWGLASRVSESVRSRLNCNVMRRLGLSLKSANRSFRIPSTAQRSTIRCPVKLEQIATIASAIFAAGVFDYR